VLAVSDEFTTTFFYFQVGPLGLIAEVPLLKEHGVDKIYQLLAEPLVTDLKNIVYLVRPNTEYMDMIATQVWRRIASSARLLTLQSRKKLCFMRVILSKPTRIQSLPSAFAACLPFSAHPHPQILDHNRPPAQGSKEAPAEPKSYSLQFVPRRTLLCEKVRKSGLRVVHLSCIRSAAHRCVRVCWSNHFGTLAYSMKC
jgi:hypothetical protein